MEVHLSEHGVIGYPAAKSSRRHRLRLLLVALAALAPGLCLAARDPNQDLSDVYLLVQQKEYDRATALARSALAGLGREASPPSQIRVELIKALGYSLWQGGNLVAAAAEVRRSLEDFERVAPDSAGVADLRLTLATWTGLLGRPVESEQLAQKALDTFERSPEDPRLPQALLNLAIQKRALGKTVDELPLLKRALKLLTPPATPPAALVRRTVLQQLSSYYELAGDSTTASKYRSAALAATADFPRDAGNDYQDLINAGMASLVSGSFSDAAHTFARALATASARFGPQSPQAAAARNSLATAYLALSDRTDGVPVALDLFDDAFRAYKSLAGSLSETEQLQLEQATELQFALFCSYANTYRDDARLAERLFDFALWEKGAVLENTEEINRHVQLSADPAVRRLWAQFIQQRSLYRDSVASGQDSRVFEYQSRAEDIQRDLALHLRLEQRPQHTWLEVRNRLSPGDAAVEVLRFFHLDGRQRSSTADYAALVLRREWQTPKYVALGSDAEVEGSDLSRYQSYVIARRYEASPPALSFWVRLEAALGEGVRRIYLAPDGVLNNVSFAVLPSRLGGLAIDRYDIYTVSSTRELVTGHGAGTPVALNAVLLGDPDFGERPNTTTGWSALPGTAAEITTIAGLLESQGWSVQPLTGPRADKPKLLAALSHHPRVLHLATHGFFDSVQGGFQPAANIVRPNSAMLRSGLILAGANAPPAGDTQTSTLTAHEVATLDLGSTELVVLSACDTGIADTVVGSEVFGLRRAFRVAGARQILMTTWQVKSEQTADLLSRFYRYWLNGSDAHEALRRAQLEIRAITRMPYYWGAFVLY